MFISLVTGAEQVRAGKLRAYGVTSVQRQPFFPEVPAIGEAVPGFESSAWFGVFAPAMLPGAITERLNAVIIAALAEPKLREQFEKRGCHRRRQQCEGICNLCSRRHRSLGATRQIIWRDAEPVRIKHG